MDKLKLDVSNRVDQLKSQVSDANYNQKALEYNKQFQKDALSLPPRINEIICDAFQSIGVFVNKATNISKLVISHDSLLQVLQTILEEIINYSPAITPTPGELNSLSLACNKLWELDVHRLSPTSDYTLNLQSGKNFNDRGDVASEPLFSYVNEEALNKPTFKAFVKLLDNYSAELGQTEVVTQVELDEDDNFLKLIMDTAVMQYTHQYLLMKHKTTATSRGDFIKELDRMWFGLYSRKAKNDSSGFEHVFIGEVKDGVEIIGFHNWIRIYYEEKIKRFNYMGYIKPKQRGLSNTAPSNHEQLVTFQFEWNRIMKKVSTSFIGTSPEFEMAMYTLCFLCGEEKNIVTVGPYKVELTCYTWNSNGMTYIATSFPAEAPIDEQEATVQTQTMVRDRNTTKAV